MDNVLLFFGGMSYEHDISVVTASQIVAKTRLKNVNILPIFISKQNRFYAYIGREFRLSDFAGFNENKPAKCFREVVFVSSEKGKLFAKSRWGLKEFSAASLAINACHGGFGEDGKLVAMLKSLGIFCASGSEEGLGIAMNKMMFKTMMRGAKVPVVSGFVINEKTYSENKSAYENRLKFASFPLVLKPVCGGSSIGLFVARSRDEFEKMLNSAFEFDENVLVERFISGAREFNVAVLGDSEEMLVSEVDEPLKIKDVLSFEDKYLSGAKSQKGAKNGLMQSQKRKFPADIDDELKTKLKALAAKVFELLNLSGVVRIDFLFDEKTGKVYVCEANAVPGSLAYYFFSAGEVLLNDFVQKLVDLAKKKRDKGPAVRQEFITSVLN